MKIIIDGRCLMEEKYSGVSWYVYNLTSEILKNDKESEFEIFGNSFHKKKLPDFKSANAKNIIYKISNKIFNLSSFFFSVPQIDKMLKGADIVWSPNFNFVNVSKKAKLIVTVHDLSFLIFPEFFSFKSWIWHKMILKTRLLQRANLIIAVSNSTKMDLVNLLKIEDNKIKVIYPGISDIYKLIDKNDLKFAEIKEKYKLPEKYILFLGTIEPRKNLESLLEAYKSIDTNINLIIVGGGGWKNKHIFEMVKTDSRVKMIGYVDEVDKPYIYNLAQFLVYPSYYEGFGLPLIEAMACGCPVIAGANSSQSEIVEDNGMLVDAYNVNEIKKAIEIFLDDENLRLKYRERGLEAYKKYTWENSAKELLECFNDITTSCHSERSRGIPFN